MNEPLTEPCLVGIFQIGIAHPHHYRPVFLDINNLPRGITVNLKKGTWKMRGVQTLPERKIGQDGRGSGWGDKPEGWNLAAIYDVHNVEHLKVMIAANYGN